MTVADWIVEPTNWVFLALALVVAGSAIRVVTSTNVVHAALFLVLALAGTAGLFLLLSAEFVAWVLVLVYIGAVIVLFLFGIMITRAPTGPGVEVDHRRRAPAAMAAFLVFVVTAGSGLTAFGDDVIGNVGRGTSTELIGEELLQRFVIPFEVVSFVLLAALIGGITLARRDASPAEEEAAEARDSGMETPKRQLPKGAG
jgi:NADH-quinone oxidoreductase subunit J